MKKNHAKTYIIVAILISIVGISIAYAALSQQLQIKTNASVQSSQTSWNIVFNISKCDAYRRSKAGTMTLDGNTITISNFILLAPDSGVSCYFSVENKGEVNAKIASINYQEPTLSGTGTSASTDVELVKSKLYVGIQKCENDSTTTNCSSINPATFQAALSSGTKISFRLIFGLEDAEQLPTNPVTFSNAKFTVNFLQT